MRVVVIGGSGQIGGWLMRFLREDGHQVFGTYATYPVPDLAPLDVADREKAAVWLRSVRPDSIFYPAGFTWVDACEQDPERAYETNLQQPLALARVGAEWGARFVYFSSDYVFDGRSGPYDESEVAHPLSVYGRAKRDAEIALEDVLGRALLTLRTTWVFGPERQGKNFGYQLIRNLSQGKTLTCPSDQISTPSYGPDVARAAVQLAEKGASGLYHIAGPDLMPRPEFARALAAAFGLDASLIVAKPTAELGQLAARPLKGGLRTPRLDEELPGLMRGLPEVIRDFRWRLEAEPEWASAEPDVS